MDSATHFALTVAGVSAGLITVALVVLLFYFAE